MTDDPSERPLRTPRLLLRCYRISDAPLLKHAIDSSLDHLRPWMPWMLNEPSPLSDIEARLGTFREQFMAGRDWVFGIFAPGEEEVLGGTGLHPRIGPDALEIGYWLRADVTGRGLATEAISALTSAGLTTFGAKRIEIRCDPRNLRSMGVPRRLGYRHVQTLIGDTFTPAGVVRDTMVWAQGERGLPPDS
ncbi:MAG TPA: GNAT family N-acetyltransferase [Polyangia bacterium]|jgi:RimJ/RimL family protein N-acetyltransferase|nr:GNAT family N-acetyltransferase [Polyangia bacterium]